MRKKQVKFGLNIIKTFEYTLEFSIKEDALIEWRLVESNIFKVNEGRWVLEKTNSKHTQVHYELEVDFGFFVPKWVSKKLTEINLPRMFDNFEARAEALASKT